MPSIVDLLEQAQRRLTSPEDEGLAPTRANLQALYGAVKRAFDRGRPVEPELLEQLKQAIADFPDNPDVPIAWDGCS